MKTPTEWLTEDFCHWVYKQMFLCGHHKDDHDAYIDEDDHLFTPASESAGFIQHFVDRISESN